MRAQTLITALLLLSVSRGSEVDPKMFLFSRGVQLEVTAIRIRTKLQPPVVQILVPTELQMETSSTAMLTCIIRGLNSNLTAITWKINDTAVAQRSSSSEVFKQPDGTFSALGFYSAPLQDWKSDGVYRCEVKQGGITYFKEVRHSLCGEFFSL
ncbi:Ig lambda chain C region [Astyanax mexicanus]|uniref:Ig-like domain-containing protein n=1 Tax=Astyanax mexicanus TaxID=7994 RepID=A0A3B1IQV9_ASTMX|nr:Ig lambda chain C region [Astyanax mexicanus]